MVLLALPLLTREDFPGGSTVKQTAFDPRVGRSPGGGNGNLLWHSCLRTPWTEEGACYSPWVTERWDSTERACAHTHTHTGHRELGLH